MFHNIHQVITTLKSTNKDVVKIAELSKLMSHFITDTVCSGNDIRDTVSTRTMLHIDVCVCGKSKSRCKSQDKVLESLCKSQDNAVRQSSGSS